MNHKNKSLGFTLMENLVALLVLSIGLLGLAGLQTSALRSNSNSALRMLAVQQAHDMADRIIANPAGVYGSAPSSASYINITPPAPGSYPDCSSSNCTPAQLAQYDEAQWNLTNESILPSGGGWVTGAPMAGAMLFPNAGSRERMKYTIIVRWDGARNGATGLGCDPNDENDLKCVTLEVYP